MENFYCVQFKLHCNVLEAYTTFVEIHDFSLKTNRREEFIHITQKIKSLLKKVEMEKGFVKIFCPHTTASISIIQNANPDVLTDINTLLKPLVPHKQQLNVEGNSDAHFKSALFGASVDIPVDNNELILGPWQGIFFCEFDGPRTRKVYVQFFGNRK